MNLRRAGRFIGCTILFCVLRLHSSFAAPPAKVDDVAGWRTLFNGRSFDLWYTYHEADGKNGDPQGVFKIENGTLHIEDSAKNNRYLATTRDFSPARAEQPRTDDSLEERGILLEAEDGAEIFFRNIQGQAFGVRSRAMSSIGDN